MVATQSTLRVLIDAPAIVRWGNIVSYGTQPYAMPLMLLGGGQLHDVPGRERHAFRQLRGSDAGDLAAAELELVAQVEWLEGRVGRNDRVGWLLGEMEVGARQARRHDVRDVRDGCEAAGDLLAHLIDHAVAVD